jgi:hypothetical protein
VAVRNPLRGPLELITDNDWTVCEAHIAALIEPVAAPPPAEPARPPEPRDATEDEVHAAIAAVHDDCGKAGVGIPDQNKLCPLVQAKLHADGLYAPYKEIKRLASNAQRHPRRLRSPGPKPFRGR